MKILRSILLIEDDSDDQEFFIEALQNIQHAFLFDVFDNGKQALDILEYAVVLPDIIFTDFHMPVMDGREFLFKISVSPRLRDIPVVCLSSDIDQREQVCRLGAKIFIKKSNDSIDLQSQIEQAIDIVLNTQNQNSSNATISISNTIIK